MEEILHQLMYIFDIPVFIRVLYIKKVVGFGISEPSAVSYDKKGAELQGWKSMNQLMQISRVVRTRNRGISMGISMGFIQRCLFFWVGETHFSKVGMIRLLVLQVVVFFFF